MRKILHLDEARQYGVHSAMPARIAQQRCPTLVFARPRFAVYKDVLSQFATFFAALGPESPLWPWAEDMLLATCSWPTSIAASPRAYWG